MGRRDVLTPNRHFGQEVIANKTNLAANDPKVIVLWLKMYKV